MRSYFEKRRLGERRELSLTVNQQALVRAGYRCETCGTKERLEFHHIGYVGDVSAFNCRVLCGRCHEKLHSAERARGWL